MYYCLKCRDQFGWPMGKYKEEHTCDMCNETVLCFNVTYKYLFPPKYDSDPLALSLYDAAKDKELEASVTELLT